MKKQYKLRALASKVLAVAVINLKEDLTVFDWAVYVDAVEGNNHSEEYIAVAEVGCKQSVELSALLFPNLPIEKYRR